LVVEIYSKSDAAGALPAAVLYDIAKFTEYGLVPSSNLVVLMDDARTLQKIYAFVKSQQGMGKLKQLFKQTDNAARLQAYRQGLTHALEVFKVNCIGLLYPPC
jgi:aminoglycoside N3'-acetyltransferase